MKNQIIKITGEETDSLAMEFFVKISGLDKTGDNNARMLRQGIDLRERIKDKINIRAVVSVFPGTAIKGNIAMLDGVSFKCNAFQSLDPDGIKGIYPFILTAGSFDNDNNENISILNQLYNDIWGTSYVEAGLTVLKGHIKKSLLRFVKQQDKNFCVLDHFGPGFYGMNISELEKFFELLDGDSIGVKPKNSSCFMIPEKSCAGFFIAVDDGTKLPKPDCKSCMTEYKNCSFCHATLK